MIVLIVFLPSTVVFWFSILTGDCSTALEYR
ncbi:hypothetical protein MG1601_544 [Mycoplasmoides gallisepticum]